MYRYHISYDLKSPGQKYNDLIDEIKTLEYWSHCLGSTFLVKTINSIDQLVNKLSQHLDSNDCLIVTEITGKITGYHTQEEWNWLNENLPE